MSELTTHSALLNMSDFGNLLVTRDQGEKVRTRLMRLLQDNPQVNVVLDGVDAYTPSFIDEVLGKCMIAVGTSEFRRAVRLIATTPEVRKLVNLVLSNRSGRQLR
jgi:hypothetical protein